MTLPSSASRLHSITGFVAWRKAVEGLLGDLDSRASRTLSGTVVIWTGGTLPAGLLTANGAVVEREDYPRLFAAIGTTYNTGGETGAQFRLPNFTTPPEHGSWAIQT